MNSDLPPGRGWAWWEGEDTPSAAAPRPETFRLGRWTPAGRDHSSKHPTETESTSPEPSAYWSKLVTLGPTANTSERAKDRQTEKETDKDRQTHICPADSFIVFILFCSQYLTRIRNDLWTYLGFLPSAVGLGCRCEQRCCFRRAGHLRRHLWQQQSLSGCRL